MTATLKTIDALARAGLVSHAGPAELDRVAERYAVAVTPAIADLIDKTDENDPIARQFLPDARELRTSPEELADPIGDRAHEPVPGIVHRYADRVLLKLIHICPVYCRFCFRREMVGPRGEAPLAGAALERALAYIGAHPEIWEVILTGGDPLIVPPRTARAVTQTLERISHLRIVRWHTRVPVADPDRVSDELARAIQSKAKTVFVVLHVNHERELSPPARIAIARLQDVGLALLSQSVLLRGVNDDTETLARLMRALTELRIKPYYLHQMDLAPGTSHFRVPLAEAQRIYAQLRSRVSGLALPSFVIDIPGGHGKVPAARGHVEITESGIVIADDRGRTHRYPAHDV